MPLIQEQYGRLFRSKDKGGCGLFFHRLMDLPKTTGSSIEVLSQNELKRSMINSNEVVMRIVAEDNGDRLMNLLE